MKIKIINACQAAGEHQDADSTLTIGKNISVEEAEKLVRMGRAENLDVDVEEKKPSADVKKKQGD